MRLGGTKPEVRLRLPVPTERSGLRIEGPTLGTGEHVSDRWRGEEADPVSPRTGGLHQDRPCN